MIKVITDQNFSREVLECESPVFVCFITRWCRDCYPTCLFADQLAEEYDEGIKFVRIDTEKSPEITMMYHVTVIPTILIFKNAQEINRLIGFHDRISLRPLLDNLIAG